MSVTASELRSQIYRLLDQVVSTGQPLEVERKGARLRISVDQPRKKLDRLVPHKCIVGNPDDLVSMDWSDTWSPLP